jgi:hypothetical protein
MNNKTFSVLFCKVILCAAAIIIFHAPQVKGADPGSPCDGNFLDANWSAKKLSASTAATANFSVKREPSGGTPADYRRTQHDFSEGSIIVAHLYYGFSYNPSINGAIISIGYRYDLRHFTPDKGAVAYRLALFQNGKFYAGPIDQIYNDKWEPFSGTNLTAADFTEIGGAGKPDFSSSGALIRFGFISANSHTTPRIIQTKISGLDNYCVRIIHAPAPPPCNGAFSDGAFNASSWTATKLNASTATTANVSATQAASDGKPGDYRRTEHTFSAGSIIVAHLNNGFTYDPSAGGAITAISYDYHLRHFTPDQGAVAYRLLLFQNGKYYAGPIDEIYNDKWEAFSRANLTSAAFTEVGGTGKPDFSSSGSLIGFGYISANSHKTSGRIQTKISGLDNYCVKLVKTTDPKSLPEK